MTFEHYRGKTVIIISTGRQGTIKDLKHKRGSGGGIAVRFLVLDSSGGEHELMPHEVKINQSTNG